MPGFTRPTPPQPTRGLGEHTALSRKLVVDGLTPQTAPAPEGGRMGVLIGALRDIANDMPGVRAVHKRTAMRERALAALRELEADILAKQRDAA